MELTTYLGLHLQATRLYREALSAHPSSPKRADSPIRAYHPPWVVAAFQRDLGGVGCSVLDPLKRSTPRAR